MSKANDRQVAGRHYATSIQHWDYVAANNLDYFQGQITKYVCRWKNKNGIEDLEKAAHFLEKYIEVVRSSATKEHRYGADETELSERNTGIDAQPRRNST